MGILNDLKLLLLYRSDAYSDYYIQLIAAGRMAIKLHLQLYLMDLFLSASLFPFLYFANVSQPVRFEVGGGKVTQIVVHFKNESLAIDCLVFSGLH